jgi:cytochrome c oxidase cbb3-type subunit III
MSPGITPGPVRQSDLQPGPPVPALPHFTHTPYDNNAYAMNEGKRLFEWFNCVGCHAHGGGGMGPALMDDEWIYGSDPAQIFNTIWEGRPNGMPSFAGKVQTQQIWQLVSYVRSLNALVRKDAAPGRDDHLNVKPAEMRLRPQFPSGTKPPTR